MNNYDWCDQLENSKAKLSFLGDVFSQEATCAFRFSEEGMCGFYFILAELRDELDLVINETLQNRKEVVL